MDDEPVWKKIKAQMSKWANAAYTVFKNGLAAI